MRDQDPAERLRVVCRLEALLLNAASGVQLGGFTMPAFTKVRSGRRDAKITHPESRWIYPGQFRYLLPAGYSTRDTSER